MNSTTTGNYKPPHRRGPQKGLPRADLKYVNRAYLNEVFGKLSPFLWVACKEGSLAGMYLYPDLRASFQKEYFGNRGHRSTGVVRPPTSVGGGNPPSPSTDSNVRPIGGRQIPTASPPLVKRSEVVADEVSGTTKSSSHAPDHTPVADEKKKSTKDAASRPTVSPAKVAKKAQTQPQRARADDPERGTKAAKSAVAPGFYDIMSDHRTAMNNIEDSISALGVRLERLEKSYKGLASEMGKSFEILLSVLASISDNMKMSEREANVKPASANTKASVDSMQDAWTQAKVPPAMPFNERYMSGGSGRSHLASSIPSAHYEPRTAPTPRVPSQPILKQGGSSTGYRPQAPKESDSSSDDERHYLPRSSPTFNPPRGVTRGGKPKKYNSDGETTDPSGSDTDSSGSDRGPTKRGRYNTVGWTY